MNDAFAHQKNLRHWELKICETAAIWLQVLHGAWSGQLLLLKEYDFTKETKDKLVVKQFHS